MSTPWTVGNQFGYLCPKCHTGDCLAVSALISVGLCPDGTDATDSDHEWDEKSPVMCSCGWTGKVADFKQAEDFDEDGDDGDEKLAGYIDALAEKHDNECVEGRGLSIDLCPCGIAAQWRKLMEEK